MTTVVYINDEKDPEPFICDSKLYLSSTYDYNTSQNISNKMFLYNIDNKSSTTTKILDGVGYLYNGMGYNPNDNFLYAMHYNKLYRIGSNKIKQVGKIKDLPSQQYLSGTFDANGSMYIGGNGNGTNKIYVLDVIAGKIRRTITLDKTLNMFDFGILEDRYLYLIPPQSFLHKIDISSEKLLF